MKTETIPTGWTRGAAIQLATKDAEEKRIAAVVLPYHKTPAGSQLQLEVATVEEYEAWRKWWFAADPPSDPRINFSFQPPKDVVHEAVHEAAPVDPAAWGRLKPLPPKVVATVNPFDKPAPTPAPNPFDQPKKPFNPFDRK